MAKYTIELRAIVESLGRDEVKRWFSDYYLDDYLTQEEINVIDQRGVWSKDKLADLIIDHYYMHEIGVETPGLFEHYAKVAMREIMEEKLPLIYSAAIKYDPMKNINLQENYQGSTNGNTYTKSNGLTIDSDTPQGQISKTNILQGKYASRTSGNEGEGTGTNDEKQEYNKTTKGSTGAYTPQKMIEQYRANIVMINRDIVNDLASLFMGVY